MMMLLPLDLMDWKEIRMKLFAFVHIHHSDQNRLVVVVFHVDYYDLTLL